MISNQLWWRAEVGSKNAGSLGTVVEAHGIAEDWFVLPFEVKEDCDYVNGVLYVQIGDEVKNIKTIKEWKIGLTSKPRFHPVSRERFEASRKEAESF
jgi:hypothetical protein